MSPIQEMHCWEIMGCSSETCVVRKHPDIPCWEVVSEMKYFQHTFNICLDCIVYVTKSNPDMFTEQELNSILASKAACSVPTKCPAVLAGEQLPRVAACN